MTWIGQIRNYHSTIPKEKAKQFLKDYKELCLKHKIYVDDCGDCNSPWLSQIEKGYEFELDEQIQHLEEIEEL